MSDFVERAAEIIYEHEWLEKPDPEGFGSCDCGWAGDGDHAKHQAEMLAQAGLLTNPINEALNRGD